MSQEPRTHCLAYVRIEALAASLGRPLTLDEVEAAIEADAPTAAKFKRINDELHCGLTLDDELIAERVDMPRSFVRSLIAALRSETSAPAPARAHRQVLQ